MPSHRAGALLWRYANVALICLAAVLAIFSSTVVCFAQSTTGRILGTLTDASSPGTCCQCPFGPARQR